MGNSDKFFPWKITSKNKKERNTGTSHLIDIWFTFFLAYPTGIIFYFSPLLFSSCFTNRKFHLWKEQHWEDLEMRIKRNGNSELFCSSTPEDLRNVELHGRVSTSKGHRSTHVSFGPFILFFFLSTHPSPHFPLTRDEKYVWCKIR